MTLNLFNCTDYKEYLRLQIEANNKTKGYQSRLAEALNCKPSFLSQVLSGKNHLSSEQAYKLSNFWILENAQADYFSNLVLIARSNDKKYISFLKQRNEFIASTFKLQPIDNEYWNHHALSSN